MSELTGLGELVLPGPNGKAVVSLQDYARDMTCLHGQLRVLRKQTNMADVLSLLIVCEFFWCGEEVAMENEIEEDVVFFSAIRLFMRREISRIRGYFEVTVPVYELDVFRSHFRMTRTTFELLAQMIIPSEHIPNGNAFGRPVVKPDKQIAMALWMMANQETHRQISDRFDVSLSSVSRCFRRVCRALVDLLPDLVRWPNGRYLYFLFIFFITQNKCLSLCKALIRNFHLLHL